MECSSYRIFINGYLDEELSPDELLKLKTHLQSCAECREYLRRAETMKTTFKHYTLFHPTPKVPEQFARQITTHIEEVVRAETPSLAARIRSAYRTFVLELAERWAGSLRTRPFAWTTLASCLLVCFAGILFFSMTSYSPTPEMAQVGETSPTAPVSAHYPAQTGSPPSSSDQEHASSFADTPDSLIRFEESGESVSDDTELVEFAEAPYVRVAQSDTGPVEEYVYSHVLEGYPDHLIDSAVFVGYVQNSLLE